MISLKNSFFSICIFFTGSIFLCLAVAEAVPKPKVGHLLSAQSLQSLQSKISSRHVNLRIRVNSRPGYRFIGERIRLGKGVILSKNSILTSASLLTLAANESSLEIEVSSGQSSKVTQGVLKQLSLKEGWALITVSTLPDRYPHKANPTVNDLNIGLTLYAGIHLYIDEAPPKRPARITIFGRAHTPMSYYWRVNTYLVPGTPLFDERGRLVSLVSQAHHQYDGLGAQSFILPTESLSELTQYISLPTTANNP